MYWPLYCVISLNLVNTCVPTHNRVDLWRNLCTSLSYFVVLARCRRKESSRLLSHLPMSFLSLLDLQNSLKKRWSYSRKQSGASLCLVCKIPHTLRCNKSTGRTQTSAKADPVRIHSPDQDDFQKLRTASLSKHTSVVKFL